VLFAPWYSLQDASSFVPPVPDPLDIGFADFDGDGAVDVASLTGDGTITVHHGPEWRLGGEFDGPPGACAISAGDADGDRIPEIITASPGRGVDIYRYSTGGAKNSGRLFQHYEAFTDNGWDEKLCTVVAAPHESDSNADVYIAFEDGSVECWRKECEHCDWQKVNTHRIPLSSPCLAWGDVDFDGVSDLVATGTEGEISGWKGIVRPLSASTPKKENGSGKTFEIPTTRTEPFFFERNSDLLFALSPRYGCAPALYDLNGDGDPEIILGDKDGHILIYSSGGTLLTEAFIDIDESLRFTKPAAGDLDGDGQAELAVGTAEGDIFVIPLLPDALGSQREIRFNSDNLIVLHSDVSYADPAIADLDLDGEYELLLGGENGTVTVCSVETDDYSGRGGSTRITEIGRLEEIEDMSFSSPSAADITGDGVIDLVVGSSSGDLHFFRGIVREDENDTRADKDGKGGETAPSAGKYFHRRIGFEEIADLAGVDLGEYVSPALGDIDRDGMIDLLAGNAAGDILVYGIDGNTLMEKGSWEFKPRDGFLDLDDYYRIYIPEFFPVTGFNDGDAVARFLEFLDEVENPYRDEVAFAAANLPVEILRTMIRRGEEDILLENAKQIYRLVDTLKYSSIVEKEGKTTLRHVMEEGRSVECPPSIYYWWVVHPRIIYELPARVDASYWDNPSEHYGLSREEWLTHEPEPDIYAPSPRSSFWRNLLPYDRRYGTSLMDAVSTAKTYREAVENLHRWLTWNREDPFMSFGYQTQDLQPLVILAKHYGSCGEQSILTAACARTVLIPNRVVGCRGEDHQWNEFWQEGEWIHWDMNNKPEDGIDAPWSSGEGRDHTHKNISAITGWRGDERLLDITTEVHNPPGFEYTKRGRGYTDTARLTFEVTDSRGAPLDGALVILRSHWEQRNMPSIWKYTSTTGRVTFEVGFEPNGGYTVEVLTPIGSAGSWNLPVVEGKEYFFSYRLPGIKPVTGSVWTRGDEFLQRLSFQEKAASNDSLSVEIRNPLGTCDAPALVSARMRRREGFLSEQYGYRGVQTGTIQVPALPGDLGIFCFSPLEPKGKKPDTGNEARSGIHPLYVGDTLDSLLTFVSPRPDREGELKTAGIPLDREWYVAVVNGNTSMVSLTSDIAFLFGQNREPPEIELELEIDSTTQTSSYFTGSMDDNLAVERIEMSADGGMRWHDITSQISFEDTARKTGRFSWSPVDSHVFPPGEYPFVFRAFDHAGQSTVSSVIPVDFPSRNTYLDQPLHQDDPESPLPLSSWILGPFTFPSVSPFLEIRTEGKTAGMDLDLFLFLDKNRDGRVNGMEENVNKSTGPVSDERIFLDQPEKGSYWIYVQGWKVPVETGEFSLFSSDPLAPGILGHRFPVGVVSDYPSAVSCEYLGRSMIDSARTTIGIDGIDVTDRASFSDTSITVPLPEKPEENHTYDLTLNLTDHCGVRESLEWSFVVDRKAPALRIMEPLAGKPVTGNFALRAIATDRHGIERVVCRMPGREETILKKNREGQDVYSAQVNVSGLPAGPLVLECVAIDRGGNEKIRRRDILILKQQD
jgi:hypothetical protein